MKLSRLLFLTDLLILVLLTVATILNYRYHNLVRANADFLSNSSDVVKYGNRFQKNLLTMQRSMRGFLLTKQEYLLDSFHVTREDNDKTIALLLDAVKENKFQVNRIQKINAVYQDWIKTDVQSGIDGLQQRKDSIKITAEDLRQVFQKEESINRRLWPLMQTVLDAEYRMRMVRRAGLERSEQRTKTVTLAFNVFAILIGFAIAVFLSVYISRRISKMVQMADAIADGNYDTHVPETGSDELNKLAISLNRMEDTLKDNISQLEERNKELDRFGYIVSHDLKAPLQMIDMTLEFTLEDHGAQMPDEAKENLAMVRDRIKSMQEMIGGILAYSRAGRITTDAETIDLKQLLNQIVQDLPKKEGVSIIIKEPMPSIKTHKLLLAQVLTNLISNAVKYHDKTDGFVSVSVREEVNQYVFQVQDNGPGIPSVLVDRIFNLFDNLDKKTGYDSSGVGLAIVKKILQERGDTIEVKTEASHGTTFNFTWRKEG